MGPGLDTCHEVLVTARLSGVVPFGAGGPGRHQITALVARCLLPLNLLQDTHHCVAPRQVER